MNHFDTPTSDHDALVHRFPARAKNLKDTRTKVRATLTQLGYCPDTIEQVVIAIDEACQNIIRHAYGQETEEAIVLRIQYQQHDLHITLRDYAPPVDADCIKLRDLRDIRPGGLGGHFMHHIMDEISVECAPEGNGNILQMHKRFA
ncbi:MAG: hypothetical protein NPIRA02_21800 [Nitrospirales bacterium]|nr:MAG: hypothetical protein NPIRA02_21800 [Nitrospirales bacterium]